MVRPGSSLAMAIIGYAGFLTGHGYHWIGRVPYWSWLSLVRPGPHWSWPSLVMPGPHWSWLSLVRPGPHWSWLSLVMPRSSQALVGKIRDAEARSFPG